MASDKVYSLAKMVDEHIDKFLKEGTMFEDYIPLDTLVIGNVVGDFAYSGKTRKWVGNEETIEARFNITGWPNRKITPIMREVRIVIYR